MTGTCTRLYALRMHSVMQCGICICEVCDCLSARCVTVFARLAWFWAQTPSITSSLALQDSAECFSVEPAQLTVSADSVAALECAFAPLRAGAAACTLLLRCDSGQVLSHKLTGTGAPACMSEPLALCSITLTPNSLAQPVITM